MTHAIDKLTNTILAYRNSNVAPETPCRNVQIKRKAIYFKLRKVIKGYTPSTIPSNSELAKEVGLTTAQVRNAMQSMGIATARYEPDTTSLRELRF